MRQSAELLMVSTDALSSKVVPSYHGERAMARSLLRHRTGSSYRITPIEYCKTNNWDELRAIGYLFSGVLSVVGC